MGVDSQALIVIVSILAPTLSGFVWMIHRMGKQFEKVGDRISGIENRMSGMEKQLNVIDLRTGFIEKLLDMFKMPHIPQMELKKLKDQ